MANVTMPQLGETVADGTVTKWFKKVGDTVVKGEPLFEVSTDKVDTEIPAPANGVLSAIHVEEGVTVDVGTILAVIGDGSEEPTTSTAQSNLSAPVEKPLPTRAAKGADRKSPSDDAQLSPVVRRLLEENDLDVATIGGSGPNGRVTRQDVLAVIEELKTSSNQESGSSQSPILRRLMSENNIDPQDVVGTGPNGAITRRDVDALIEAPLTSATGSSRDEVIPFTKIRKLTAEHMVRSKATSAHTLMVKEVDYEQVELVRARHGAAFKESEGFSLSYLPFNAVAAVEALKDFPRLNASVGVDELVVHHDVNLGIAVDVDNEGLVVPVVRRAERLNLKQIAGAIRDVAERARSKRLGPDELAGGTFTISNPGPFGTLLTGAVINQPQVAILSTDSVVRKPVVITANDGTESVGIHSIGLLALTFDHRAVDGAYAARFLARMAEVMTTRVWDQDLA